MKHNKITNTQTLPTKHKDSSSPHDNTSFIIFPHKPQKH